MIGRGSRSGGGERGGAGEMLEESVPHCFRGIPIEPPTQPAMRRGRRRERGSENEKVERRGKKGPFHFARVTRVDQAAAYGHWYTTSGDKTTGFFILKKINK